MNEALKRFLPLLLAALVAPVAASTHHQKDDVLLAHATPHKVVYLLFKVGESAWKIPMKTIEECEAIGPEIIESQKITKMGKGYECIPGLM